MNYLSEFVGNSMDVVAEDSAEYFAMTGKEISEAVKNIAKEYVRMPGSFSQTLKYHMKKRKMTVEALSWASGISAKSIGNYRNNPEAKPDFNTVLALCKGLNLSPSFTVDLLEKMGYDLMKPVTEEKKYLQILVFYHYMEDLDSWNRRLKAWGSKVRIPNVDAVRRRAS